MSRNTDRMALHVGALSQRLNLEPATVRLKRADFAQASDIAVLRLAQPTPDEVVPVLKPSVAVKIAAARYIDPKLAQAISEVRFPTTGLTRDKITVPISPAEDVTDLVLFEDAGAAGKKFYLPRYRLGVETVSGSKQYRASLVEDAQGWRLTLHLEKYAAQEIELLSRAAGELPHQVAVILQYQLAGSGGIRKELIFQEVTAESGGIAATLAVNSLGERDELVRALTGAEYNTSLIVRRALKVAVPVPRQAGGPQVSDDSAPDMRRRFDRRKALLIARRPQTRGAEAAGGEAEVVSSGTGMLRGTWSFDLDSGKEETGGDIWWEQRTSTERRLVPQAGAQIVGLGAADFDALTPAELQELTYGAEPLDGSLSGGFGPDSVVHLTQDWSVRGKVGVYNNHSVGVWFDGGAGAWSIFNEDIAPMPAGAGFHVKLQKPGETAFIHRALASNISGHITYLDHPALNANPQAILAVTHDWQPPGASGVYNPRHIGVWFDPGRSRWSIFNQGLEPMPPGACFSVEILVEGPTAFIHRADAGNTSGHVTHLSHPSLNGDATALMSVTQDWQPRGAGGVYNNHSLGVWDRGGGQWSIFNQDIAAMPAGASFHIVVRRQDESCFPHVATAENTSGHITYLRAGGPEGNQLAKGSVFAVRTNGGNYAKVQVQEYGYNLTLRWVTYASAGAASGDVAWVDDELPPGAVPHGGGETWTWVEADPSPFSGRVAHQSAVGGSVHQHFFERASNPLTPAAGESLFAYVHLDPANLPSEVMLQWNDGSWEHRAFWGADKIGWGVTGTASRLRIGDLPPAGRWVRLEVPAAAVGLEGRPIHGMAFTLFGGRATWDLAGKSAPGGGGDAAGGPQFREVTRTLDAVQHPFLFDRASHPYIFQGVSAETATPQGPGIIRRQFKWKNAWGTFFQEKERPYLFYFLPDALKIARRPQHPHGPIMSVQFESSDGTRERMQVQLDYVAAPHVDAARLEAAAAEFRRYLPPTLPPGINGPVFEPLQAGDDQVRFSVGLPRADTSRGPFQLREGALVNIRTGLKDSLKLPLQDFETIFDAMADTTGAAILFNGEIEVSLGEGPGAFSEKVPFTARMNDLVGELFDYSETPDAATGGVNCMLRNAIESPLRIKQLTARLRRGEAEAVGVVDGLTLPAELAPGQNVRFAVRPEGELPGAGAPQALFDLGGVEVLPDREAIWNVIAASLRPEYYKQITVQTFAPLFDPARRPNEQLIEIDVDFKLGETVVLTPDKLSGKTTVGFPVADLILRKSSSSSFEYRVTTVSNVRTGDGRTEVSIATDEEWKSTDASVLRIADAQLPKAPAAG